MKRREKREMYQAQRETELERYRRYWRENKEARKLAYRVRYAEAPHKMRARSAVKNAVKRGLIQKKPCRCGAAKVEAHHDDYRRPLDVRWFCRKHHAAWHRVFLVEE